MGAGGCIHRLILPLLEISRTAVQAKVSILNIFFPVVPFITLKYKVVITFELWI